MTISACADCKEIDGVYCYGYFKAFVGLPASTAYTAFVKDKFGNQFTVGFTSGADGSMNLNLAGLPEGLFTPYSGHYEMSVSTNTIKSTAEDLVIDGTTYNCILVKFNYVG